MAGGTGVSGRFQIRQIGEAETDESGNFDEKKKIV